ncbi:MAG: SOS response-associated peptidase [Pseudomonadota bacterium]
MCGRFSQNYTWRDIYEAYEDFLQSMTPKNLEPRYNIGRFQECDVIRTTEDGGVTLDRALFELIPFWWKKPRREKKFSSFNAKAEGILSGDAKSFVPSWKHGKRCIVPVSGFYEWPRPATKGQPPYLIHSTKGPLLHLAGLWSAWRDPELDDEEIITVAIVTTTPNELMQSLPHHRCPVALSEPEANLWLMGTLEEAATLLKPPAETLMSAVRVGSYVNKIGNEGPDCIDPALSD